jgi:putative acyl-CoA dehydrogenase
MRLKSKVGDRSNASSEVEYHDAVGYIVGEHARGIKTIMEMVALTRLDCATGSAGIMRSAVFSAGLHVSHRQAFCKTLLQHSSMTNVLADLEIECEASTMMALTSAAALGIDAGRVASRSCVLTLTRGVIRRRGRCFRAAGCANKQARAVDTCCHPRDLIFSR